MVDAGVRSVLYESLGKPPKASRKPVSIPPVLIRAKVNHGAASTNAKISGSQRLDINYIQVFHITQPASVGSRKQGC